MDAVKELERSEPLAGAKGAVTAEPAPTTQVTAEAQADGCCEPSCGPDTCR